LTLAEAASNGKHDTGIGLLRASCSAVAYQDAGREAEAHLPLASLAS